MIKTIPVVRKGSTGETKSGEPKQNLDTVAVVSAQGFRLNDLGVKALELVKGDKISFGPVQDAQGNPTGEFAIYKDNISGKVTINEKPVTTNATLKESLVKFSGQTDIAGKDLLFEVSTLKYDADSNTPYIGLTYKGTKQGRVVKARAPKAEPVAFAQNKQAEQAVVEQQVAAEPSIFE
jgi:hypothetical protein